MIPDYIEKICETLEKKGFECCIVGGSVRDLLMEKKEIINPKDWDLTTNARPKSILEIFSDSKYENEFGTVLLPIKNNNNNKTEQVVEITTYRSEKGYSDRRHPDDVVFEDNLEKDLERRDFTINAMALQIKNYELKITNLEEALAKNIVKLVDLFGGQKDLKKKVIRAVGEPIDRFKEDSLRMMRAVRFSSQLNFSIEPKTERGIVKMAGSIKFIAKERIRDEFIRILESDTAYNGVMDLYRLKLLHYIIPELEEGVNVKQSRHHTYTVFKHSTLSLKYCPSKDWRVRFASLLHDIGKPKTRKIINNIATFYNHEYAGERMVRKIVKRLKFSNKDAEKIINLVRNHMFYYNTDEVTAASVRRLIKKVGKENLKDLIDIRIADRLGSGTPKAKPYRLRHLEYMMEKVQNDPVSVKMLKINGNDLMEVYKIKPGPIIGAILEVLLSEVIEDPKLNTEKYLLEKSKKLKDLKLEELREKAKDVIEEKRRDDDKKIKNTYKVR